MTTRDAAPGEGPRGALLQRIGERAGVGAVLAALGFCCATALLGSAVVSGAVGAVMGFITGIVAGSAWPLVVAVACGSWAAAWLGIRHRHPRL